MFANISYRYLKRYVLYISFPKPLLKPLLYLFWADRICTIYLYFKVQNLRHTTWQFLIYRSHKSQSTGISAFTRAVCTVYLRPPPNAFILPFLSSSPEQNKLFNPYLCSYQAQFSCLHILDNSKHEFVILWCCMDQGSLYRVILFNLFNMTDKSKT